MAEPIGLTEETRSLRRERMAARVLASEAIAAAPFLVAVALLLAVAPPGSIEALDVVLLVLLLAVMGRLKFETGAGSLVPTQLAFVPMLFVLAPALAPLVVVAGFVVGSLPDVIRRRQHPSWLISAVADATFAIGPAIVFVVFDVREPAFADWPVYVLALAAQFAGDLGSSTLRERIGRGVRPQIQLDILREVWLVDVLLSPIGLLAALASAIERYAFLLVLPLGALLSVFARERRERIGTAIELSSAYRGTALLLGDVLTEDDEYTGMHSQGVVVFALAIADELKVDEEERRMVEFGALLHDIGKMSTPKEILNKAGPLDDDEWETMCKHTIDGQRMLDQVGGTLHEVGAVVRSSHERYDGTGYPDKLRGEAIPHSARIVAVADAYSAMTTRRSYREAMSPVVAAAELRANAGTQFDPRVVDAALTVLARDLDVPVALTGGETAA
ncbi:MAG: HD-GYP domain-containing protein [Thermoleophilia bacterium]